VLLAVKILYVRVNAAPPEVAMKRLASEAEAAFEIVNSVTAAAPANEGAAENSPKPNADTATSAMRLRSVFVDICFLSISRVREFPALGFE
jgi:hypothetical protein